MRLFVASDIHGSDVCWRKFLNAGAFYKADVLVLAGDVTGKALVPLIEQLGGTYRTRFMGRDLTVAGADVEVVEAQIRYNGFYPYRCSPQEADLLQADPAERGRVFTASMRSTAETWVGLADERLRGTGTRCLVMPGNDDEPFLDEVLGASEAIENPDGRVIEIEGFRLIGHGWSNPTPWHTTREKPDDQIEADLERLVAGAPPGGPVILVPHVPPYRSGLDDAPELRPDLTVVMTAGQPRMVPVGSQGVRQVIERHQPLLSLHGHIHESRGVVRIGRTTSVNPGSEYNVGRLLGAVVDLARDSVKNVQLVAG